MELREDWKEEHESSIAIVREVFADKLKELRKEKSLSQKQVAERLEVAVSTYANWEQGRREPSIFDLIVLMSIFEVDANELFNIDHLF